MAVYDKDSRLADALMAHPSLIPVVNRLGVQLGVGDKTISDLCNEHGLNVSFFLSIVNTFVDDDYFPHGSNNVFSLEKTIDYLEKTSNFYLRIQLVNIDHHFNGLISRSGTDNNLYHLREFFNGMKKQLEENLEYELRVLFPRLRQGDLRDVSKEGIISASLEIEERLQDLLTFFVVHLKGEYDRNLCMAVVTAIFSLERDIHQNNRIRERILVPLIEGMKQRSES